MNQSFFSNMDVPAPPDTPIHEGEAVCEGEQCDFSTPVQTPEVVTLPAPTPMRLESNPRKRPRIMHSENITEERSIHSNMNIFAPDIQAELCRRQRDTTTLPRLEDIQAEASSAFRLSRYKEEFHEVKLVGRGSTSAVYICAGRLDGAHYAIKVMHKLPPPSSCNDLTRRDYAREIFAHAALGDSPHIVRYYGSWCEDDRIYLQLEHCQYGSLHTFPLFGPEPMPHQARQQLLLDVLMQISMGLKHMHAKGICHMDIKTGNILVTAIPSEARQHYQLKIADLGLAVPNNFPIRSVLEGDRRCCAPELLEDSGAVTPDMLRACDIYSLGATLYEIARGRSLPQNGAEYRRLRSVESAADLPGLQGWSQEWTDLLVSMLHVDPRKRPSVEEILAHTLLQGYGGQGVRVQISHLTREVGALKQRLGELVKRRQLMTHGTQEEEPTSINDSLVELSQPETSDFVQFEPVKQSSTLVGALLGQTAAMDRRQ